MSMKVMSSRALNNVLFVLAMLCVELTYAGGQPIKALFIGNSLTHYNNLPGMIEDIAKSKGDDFSSGTYTRGGAHLKNHVDNPEVTKSIASDSWDFVVIQEQSQRPGFSWRQVFIDVYPNARILSERVKETDDKSRVVFYMTMARRNGDPDNKSASPELLTYEGMQKRVNRTYINMGKKNNALVAPVGEVWATIRKENPNVNLYLDDVHPNVTGTYIAACVFYATFFDKASAGSYIPKEVGLETGEYIQGVVDSIVLHPDRKWNYEDYRSVGTIVADLISALLLLIILVLPWVMVLFSRKVKGIQKSVWFTLSFVTSWIGYFAYYMFFVQRDSQK